MASSYPTSVDNHTQVTDGVDIIQAQDVNLGYDSIDAIQTFVGTSGAAQSHNIDVLGWITEQNPSMKLSYVDDDTVQVSAGLCVTQNSGGSVRKLRQNSSTTNVTFADIDTGARISSTEYYVWADGDASATTTAFVISASAVSPTGVTNYVLVGGFYNDASDNILEDSVWSVAGMRVVNTKYILDGDVATGTNTIPRDSSIPQDTEGDEYMSLSYVPQKSTNLLKVEVVFNCKNSADDYVHAALFTGSSANAIGVSTSRANYEHNMKFTVYLIPGSTNYIRFAVRAGTTSTGTVTFNGSGGSVLFGGVMASSITCTEYEV